MSDTGWKDGQEEQEFEQALARSLRRVEAPEDFLARVMARAEKQEPGNRERKAGGWRLWRRPAPGWGWKPAWGALAAVLAAGVLTGHVVHEHRLEQQARASQEFDVSVQITDKALDHAREQLLRAGVRLDEGQ